MRSVAWSLLAGIAFLLGCDAAGTPAPHNADVQLRVLGRLYGEYMAQHNSQPPADEAQFKASLSQSPDILKATGIATIDQLFVSPRDGQPLVVLFGEKIVPNENSGFPWIAYESQGVDGKKYIIGARGNVEEMAQEQIEAMATC